MCVIRCVIGPHVMHVCCTLSSKITWHAWPAAMCSVECTDSTLLMHSPALASSLGTMCTINRSADAWLWLLTRLVEA